MEHIMRLMSNSMKRVQCKRVGFKNEGLIHVKAPGAGRRCRGQCWRGNWLGIPAEGKSGLHRDIGRISGRFLTQDKNQALLPWTPVPPATQAGAEIPSQCELAGLYKGPAFQGVPKRCPCGIHHSPRLSNHQQPALLPRKSTRFTCSPPGVKVVLVVAGFGMSCLTLKLAQLNSSAWNHRITAFLPNFLQNILFGALPPLTPLFLRQPHTHPIS